MVSLYTKSNRLLQEPRIYEFGTKHLYEVV